MLVADWMTGRASEDDVSFAAAGGVGYSCRMSPSGRLVRALCVLAFLLFGVGGLRAQAGAGVCAGVFVAEGLGRGTVAVDGPWQFQHGR